MRFLKRFGLAAGVLAVALGAALMRLPGVQGASAVMLNPNHQCAFCHQLHGAPGQTLLQNAVVETLCLTCHGPGGISALKAAVHRDSAGSFSKTCLDCHTPHSNPTNYLSGTNLELVKAAIQTRNVAFESRGLGLSQPAARSFADGDATYDGVCEVCHTTTRYHQNSGAGYHGHEQGGTCTVCHRHEGNFQAPTRACNQCHNTAQGTRRAIIPELGYVSHHDSTLLQGSLNVSDCVTCHDVTKHQQGNVRLWNVEFPTDTTPGRPIALTGNPRTTSTEAAKLNSFCLNCHDTNGANGSLTPFADGRTRPLIDTALWNASSHKTGNRSCFGDGTFGCHDTGHGSQKHRLLAPAGSGPGTNNVAEEEGFCYNCHDANGPASRNLQTVFGLTRRHPVNDAEQTQPGRTVECTDCHDPHGAKGRARTYSATADSNRRNIAPVNGGVLGWAVNYGGLGNFAAPAIGNYSDVNPAVYEYQICFKCHAGKSWSFGTPPNGLSPNGAVTTPVETDAAQEFSPNNRSGHPIVTGLNNYPNSIAVGSPVRKGLQPAALKAPWNTNVGSQTMTCSDCHTISDTLAAQGPHGSASDFILRGPNTAWPRVGLANFATSFCANCHNNSAGEPHAQGGHTSSLTGWSLGSAGLPCYRCHIVIPHGGAMSRLIGDGRWDGIGNMPARYAYSNILDSLAVERFTKAATTGYTTGNCRARCYADHQTTAPSENWP